MTHFAHSLNEMHKITTVLVLVLAVIVSISIYIKIIQISESNPIRLNMITLCVAFHSLKKSTE